MSYVKSNPCLETTINTNTTKRYTHYYDINANEPDWKLIWPQLIEEIHAIIEASGVEVTDHNGAEYNQRHGEIYYCDFDEDQGEEVYRIIPFPIVDIERGIWINGTGYDAHFPFIMEDGGWAFMTSVETAHEPYDDVVTCILLRAFMLAPNACRISSDAFWDKWEPARSIYRHLFDEEPECPWGRMNRPFEFVLGILNGSGCLLGIRAMGEAIDI